LAVLQLLLDLEDSDMMVFSSKSAGGWTWNWTKPYTSYFQIPKPNLPPRVVYYLQNDFTRDNHDFLLYAAANRSLALTMDQLGRAKVKATFNGIKDYDNSWKHSVKIRLSILVPKRVNSNPSRHPIAIGEIWDADTSASTKY
jgi:hypothetical protein